MIFDTDECSSSALYFNKFISIAKKHKKKIFVISIGIGPFKTQQQEKNTINALGQCDYITFRDLKSYSIYKKYTNNVENVFISVDPVFLFPYSIKPCVLNELVIGLNVFNNKLVGAEQESYNGAIDSHVKLIKAILNKFDVKIILFSTDLADYEAIYDLYDKLSECKNIEVRQIGGIGSLLILYGEISVLIGARMHAMIIALTQHIPIIGLSWQQKVEEMFNIIDAKDCLFKYDDIEKNVNRILSCCDYKLINLHYERTLIKQKLDFIRERTIFDENIMSDLTKEILS